MPDRYGNPYKWENKSFTIHDEAFLLGKGYMEGKHSIGEVESYLNKQSHYAGAHTRKEITQIIARGAKQAEEEGTAKTSRVQPKQEAMNVGTRRRNPGKGGKLATRPESTRYKPPTKEQAKEQKRERAGTRPYAARPAALNAYDVMAQRKRDLHELLKKHARGQVGVKEVKRESKSKAQGAAYKNVVYNETHHRYVGPNRPGAPPKKEWDYQPKRTRKKVTNKYVITYKQGGAINQQVSETGSTQREALAKFSQKHPRATKTDIRLVMRGD